MEIFNLEEGIKKTKIMADILSCRPVIIGITGGSCSGKGYFSKLLSKNIEDSFILSMDDYYKSKEYVKDNNFDTPEALDLELLNNHLSELKYGNSIEKPIFYFPLSTRMGYEIFIPTNRIILEGLFCLCDLLRDKLDIKVFIECSEEARLNRRIKRDINRVRSTEEKIQKRWNRDVQPAYLKYIEPQKQYADIIIKNE